MKKKNRSLRVHSYCLLLFFGGTLPLDAGGVAIHTKRRRLNLFNNQDGSSEALLEMTDISLYCNTGMKYASLGEPSAN